MYKLTSNIDIFTEKKYYEEIDFIKSIAILSVIVLHSLSTNIKLRIFAPFHIWHAVPIFMVVAGINSSLLLLDKDYEAFKEYSLEKIKKKFIRIVIPFIIILACELLLIYFFKGPMEESIFYFIISGGYGAGSYFVPIFIQHILIFPLVLIFLRKTPISYFNKIVFLFLVSILLEKICMIAGISEEVYRLLYVRYFFASVLGAVLVICKPKFFHLILFSCISFLYIFYTSYYEYELPIIYPAWIFQHAPAYFWTLMIILLLWFLYPKLSLLSNSLMKIGKYSYHIFLVQMVYFWCFDHFVKNAVIEFININYYFIYTVINCIFCIIGGICFFKINYCLYFLFVSMSKSIAFQRNH